MNELANQPDCQANRASETGFGRLVFDETVRRSLRKSPQARFDMLRASLRDSEKRGMIPLRNRAEHERRLQWLIQHASSRS